MSATRVNPEYEPKQTGNMQLSSQTGSNVYQFSFTGNAAYAMFRRGNTACFALIDYWTANAKYIGTQGNITITKAANSRSGTITVVAMSGAVVAMPTGNMTIVM